MKQVLSVLLVLIIAALSAFGCTPEGNDGEAEYQMVDKSTLLMDTQVTVMLYTQDTQAGEEAIESAFEEIERLENLVSRHVEASEVSEINRLAGEEPVEVSDKTWEIITRAIDKGDLTDGHFDVTIAPLLKLWGFGEDELQVPREDEIQEVIQLIDYQSVKFDEENQSVFLPNVDMEFDLGGAAKGYIVDQAVNIVEEKDVGPVMIDAGDISVSEAKPGDEAWRLGIKHPREDSYFAVIEIEEGSIDTSGDYERYFTENDTRYHHIMSPFTGHPTEGIISVTVVSDDALQADVLSTAAFSLGTDTALDLFDKMDEVEALIVEADGKYHYTPGLESKLEILEEYQGGSL